MSAAALVHHSFGDQQRRGFEAHLGAQLLERAGADAVGGHFLISDDSPGNMPAGPEELVVPPGQQRAPGVVLPGAVLPGAVE